MVIYVWYIYIPIMLNKKLLYQKRESNVKYTRKL